MIAEANRSRLDSGEPARPLACGLLSLGLDSWSGRYGSERAYGGTFRPHVLGFVNSSKRPICQLAVDSG